MGLPFITRDGWDELFSENKIKPPENLEISNEWNFRPNTHEFAFPSGRPK